MKIPSIYLVILLSLLVLGEVAAQFKPIESPAPIGKSGKTLGPAKAGKQGKGTSNVSGPDDSNTGDSNGEIEIPLDASMSTSLSFPAGDIPGEFGKIDEIPLDASLSMSF
jgi:hypothetical protein